MARNARKKPDQFVVRKRADLAKALGVSVGRVDQFLAGGMGLLKTDGAYSVAACKAWVADHVQKHGGNRGKRQPPADSDEALMDPTITGTSPALERFRHARAGLAELELQAKQGQFLPRQLVHECFGRVASLLRAAGDRLKKDYGPEALKILNEALEDALRAVGELCDEGNATGV